MAAPEHSNGSVSAPSVHTDRVMQPLSRLAPESGLHASLGMILEEVNRISETAASGPGEQWQGSSGTAAVAAKGDAAATVTARQQAIAQLPPPRIMQKRLEQHITKQIKQLRKEALSIARMSQPGSAHRLNMLYARIRSLNTLFNELLQASYDVLQRLFIRVCIDKQKIV